MTVISSYKILQNWNLITVNAPRGKKSNLRYRIKQNSEINKVWEDSRGIEMQRNHFSTTVNHWTTDSRKEQKHSSHLKEYSMCITGWRNTAGTGRWDHSCTQRFLWSSHTSPVVPRAQSGGCCGCQTSSHSGSLSE